MADARVESTIAARFREAVRQYEHRQAITDRGVQLTYGELLGAAAGVAEALDACGIAPGEPVALLADQGRHAVVAMLGVTLPGGVFAPLDVVDPPGRSRALIELAGARVLMTTAARRPLATAIASTAGTRLRVLEIDGCGSATDRGVTAGVHPGSPATIFFTSGSTGRPKAVLDLQRNVLHNAFRYTKLLEITLNDRLSVVQRPSFSGIASSVFGALLNGSTLCTYPLDGDTARDMASWVLTEEVTIFHGVPAIVRVLGSSGRRFPSIRVVRMEGDRATWDDVRAVRDAFPGESTLASGLGTTETGLVSQLRVRMDGGLGSGVLPVGHPAPDIEVEVVGEDGRPVASGAVGEIAVRSAYLAQGYVGDPELTAERFVADPRDNGRRRYLTRDLGRLNSDGELEVLGRRDGGAKIRGIRVEPAEVERALLALPSVRAASVGIRAAGSRAASLVAVVVPAYDGVTTGAIESELRAALPEHMVPARLELASELPVDGNWKVRPPRGRGTARPGLEAELTAIWEAALTTRVGPEDRFIDLGGDSLIAAQIEAAIEERLGIDVPDGLIAHTPTVASLATALEAGRRTDATELVVLSDAPVGSPLVVIPDHHGDPLMFAHVVRHLGTGFPIYGATLDAGRSRSIPDDAEMLAAAIRRLPSGQPPLVVGFCYGALLAVEVSRRLRQDGQHASPILLGLRPSDLPEIVSADALERWWRAYGARALGLARIRFHVRHALGRAQADRLRYLLARGAPALTHLGAAVRRSPAAASVPASGDFRLQRFDGAMDVVLAESIVSDYTSDASAAWAGLGAQVRVTLVPGPWSDTELLGTRGSPALATAIAAVVAGR